LRFQAITDVNGKPIQIEVLIEVRSEWLLVMRRGSVKREKVKQGREREEKSKRGWRGCVLIHHTN